MPRFVALAVAVGVALGAPAVAAIESHLPGHDEAVVSATPPMWSVTGWPALAGLGLAAVVVGAAGARRPRHRAHGRAAPAGDRPVLAVAHDPKTVATHARPRPALDGPEPRLGAAGDPRAYLALHHVDLAIDTLRRRVDDDTRPMPVAWLMLLDLYRTHGREQAFRELAERFHARFNAQAPDWNRYPPAAAEPGLEAFPRLIKEITLSWGTHDCSRLLDRLLYDNRNGRRHGFSLNAYNDLLALRALSNELVSTIEADFTEEAALRDAFAAASAQIATPNPSPEEAAATPGACGSGALAELESQLEDDLRKGGETRSPLELEHPALAGMLTREWGNSAVAARLCEILAHGVDPARPLSGEAAEDLATLKRVARDLSGADDARR